MTTSRIQEIRKTIFGSPRERWGNKDMGDLLNDIEFLLERIDRLQEALEWYMSRDYPDFDGRLGPKNEIILDRGQRARAALEEG